MVALKADRSVELGLEALDMQDSMWCRPGCGGGSSGRSSLYALLDVDCAFWACVGGCSGLVLAVDDPVLEAMSVVARGSFEVGPLTLRSELFEGVGVGVGDGQA